MIIRKCFAAGAATASLTFLLSAPAQAQERVIGEVITVGYSFCPRGTLEASGQLLSIASYETLFSLLGSTYGGDGRVNFALPDLRGRYTISQGQGPGLPHYTQGSRAGSVFTTLLESNMPNHTHDGRIRATTSGPTTNSPVDATFPTFAVGQNIYSNGNDNTAMHDDDVQIARTGGGQPFSVMNPYLTTRQCVVTEGIYPSRN